MGAQITPALPALRRERRFPIPQKTHRLFAWGKEHVGELLGLAALERKSNPSSADHSIFSSGLVLKTPFLSS